MINYYDSDSHYKNYASEYDFLNRKIKKISSFVIDGISGHIIVDEVCVRGRCSGIILLNKVKKCSWYINNSNEVVINSDNANLYKLSDVLIEIFNLKMMMMHLFERMLIIM